MVASVQTIMNDVPPENVLAMVDAVIEFGSYPFSPDLYKKRLPGQEAVFLFRIIPFYSFTYGCPSAAGGVALPTTPATTMMVTK